MHPAITTSAEPQSSMTTSTMDVPTQSPLHSHSHTYSECLPSLPSSAASRGRRRKFRGSTSTLRTNTILHMTLIITLVFSTTLLSPVQAKYRLVPRKDGNTKTSNTKNKKDKHAHAHSDSGSGAKSSHRLILMPRQKKQEETLNLKLEATVSTNEKGEKVLLLSPESTKAVETAMESTGSEEEESTTMKMEAKQPKKKMASTEAETVKTKVLMYDPEDLPKTGAGQEPLPKRVYDEDGNEVDMAGKEALLVLPPPPDEGSETDDGQTTTTGSETKETKTKNNKSNAEKTSAILQTTQTQDQMIIISTVATMALLVGALSARRLRSRQFLSFCIENESLEDELAYDAAYTTQSTVGASSLYAGGGYDTFASGKYGGDLRWRGDLEKFDV